jgi:pimeloyl-ACP methyl ester carboxylesterase
MKHAYVLPLFLTLFLVVACGDGSPIVSSRRSGHQDELTFRSAFIAQNSVSEPAEKIILVLLPPGYDAGTERYPVIYYLPGYGEYPTQVNIFSQYMYDEMEGGRIKPFIMVAVNGATALGGSFFVNSSRTGRWEDHVTTELTNAIDERYRTVAAPGGRGLMGFSMGGFGVLHLGLAHPDLFSTVWSLCPGVFAPGKGLGDAMLTWKGNDYFLKAYAAAFTDENAVPVFDGSSADKKIAAEWEAGFGGWAARLDAYAARGARLEAIRIVSGKYDSYRWITEGSRVLAEEMKKRGLPIEAAELSIGHEINATLVLDDALPFFDKHLKR